MSELPILVVYLLKGMLFMGVLVVALMAFGAVMCFVSDVDNAPIAKTCGGVILFAALAVLCGWAITP